MATHGFNEEKIMEHFQQFEKETGAEREKSKTLRQFNDDILKAKKEHPLGKVCKGLFVGNILLNNAKNVKHEYLIAHSEDFIIIIPYGPIQSVLHLMAIPKVPLYNVVTLGMEDVLRLRKMQAALKQVVKDILTPDSLPQKLYLRALCEGIEQEANAINSIRITQGKNLDTKNMGAAKAGEIFPGILNDYYKKKSGIDLEEVICTDLHIHPTNSVGQLHMHGWIAEPALITDMGIKLTYKNTPVGRVIPVLAKHRGGELGKEKKIKVIVKSEE